MSRDMVNIVMSDLHLTDNPLDEYRWDFLNSLRDRIVSDYENRAQRLIILGDLTENTNKHSESLVNRLTDVLVDMIDNGVVYSIWILSGNHDGITSDRNFFRFLRHIGRRFLVLNTNTAIPGIGRELWLPYTKNPVQDWDNVSMETHGIIYMHQKMVGAKTQSGFELQEGLPPDYFYSIKRVASNTKIFSGDIHKPQTIGNILYVGAPYHIYFGDKYEGRVLVLRANDMEIETEWTFNTPRKLKIVASSAKDIMKHYIKSGDQVRAFLNLTRESFHNAQKYVQKTTDYLISKGAVVVSVEAVRADDDSSIKGVSKHHKNNMSDKDLVLSFSKRNKLSKRFVRTGLEILKETGL